MNHRPLSALLCLTLPSLVAPGAFAQEHAPAPDEGWTAEVSVEHAAYHHAGVPSAVVHVPARLDAGRPLQLVVFLHGFSGCARVLMGSGAIRCRPQDPPRDGWALSRHHAAARTNTLLIIPQLALLQRDGRPGCFGRDGCFRHFLEELLHGPLAQRLGGTRSLADVAGVSLIAHSAGFQSALAILEHGQVDELVRHVVLLDALYAGTDGFARWLRASRDPRARLVTIHLGRGKPHRNSEQLYRRLRRSLGAFEVATGGADGLAAAVADKRLVVARGRGSHRRLPREHLGELLRALWPAAEERP